MTTTTILRQRERSPRLHSSRPLVYLPRRATTRIKFRVVFPSPRFGAILRYGATEL